LKQKSAIRITLERRFIFFFRRLFTNLFCIFRILSFLHILLQII